MSGQTVAARQSRGDVWIRRSCALVVAGVAAYSSYAHQRHFALEGGADQVSAALWPLSVDGLVVLASLGLVRARADMARRARVTLWLAFLLGVAVSLAANIAAAPTLGWQPVLVAGWPPLALLLAVELVVHSRTRDTSVTVETPAEIDRPETVTLESGVGLATRERDPASTEVRDSPTARMARRSRRGSVSTAEALMWAHFEAELKSGRTPTGAELDRVAGTNNYGRAVLARWRSSGRIPPVTAPGDAA